MKITTVKIEDLSINYPFELIADPKEIIFVDIETTGFTARSSKLYMIGCGYYEEGDWYVRQYFAETYSEEADIIKEFYSFLSCFKCIIHFNGNKFDIPYLQQKSDLLHLECDFSNFEGVDIFKRISPLKKFLNLPNCKQKTLEVFTGIHRSDEFSGGELISVYHSYVKEPSEDLLLLLFLHNADDIKGMLQLLPVLSYYDLFAFPLVPKKVQAGRCQHLDGSEGQELVMKFALHSPVPTPVSCLFEEVYVHVEDNYALIKVPLYEEEMKYFYAAYKDYYYLPDEDVALHKSVASFVDKAHRVQANAANCYTKKYSLYLKQWGDCMLPVFKRSYEDDNLYFELTDDMKKDRDLFSLYAYHILSTIAKVQR